MANEQSPPQSGLDSSQVPQNTHHQQFGVVKTMSGFLAGKVGRKIVITPVSSTIDDVFFQQGSDVLMTYRITYNNSDHDAVTEAERIA